MSNRKQVEVTLARLIGEPMWAAGRAGIVWFQFGADRATIDRRGNPRAVGTFALHITCPWRWLEPWGDVRADDQREHADLVMLGQERLQCVAVTAGESGGFCLTFSDRSTLIVEPDDGASEGDDDEYWRLFSPGQDTAHFVIGRHGIAE